MLKSKISGSSKNELESILSSIQHYCAYQERCSLDVDLKLTQWKVSTDKIRKIMTHLKKEGFIDDERYARIFVRSKFHINKWGRTKIRYELKYRNIPDNLISKAMEEIGDDDYIRTIQELILKKKSEINTGKNLNIREKIITFVTGKGFEFDLISKVLTELKI
ncbi:MAG: regulatory protein RecX [Bacteroidetes bacterium]|nr:regulatory protein RecX [Bacteroidota bacterium]